MNISNGKQTVYHISPLRLWLVPGMMAAFAVFFLTLLFDDSGSAETKNLALYAGIGFFGFAIIMYLILRYTRLVLSADGIRLYQFGYKLETDWSNVAALSETPGGEGLILHRPLESGGARLLSKLRNTQVEGANFYSDAQIRLLAEKRFIPIDAFAYHLDRGRLRDDLNRRVPALKIQNQQ